MAAQDLPSVQRSANPCTAENALTLAALAETLRIAALGGILWAWAS